MDRKTSKILHGINMDAAMNHKKDLVKEKKVFEHEREMAKIYMKNAKTREAKNRIAKMLDSGAYDRTTQVIDEKAAREIEEEVEGRVRAAIRSGRIKPAERDAFIRRMQKGG